MDNYIYYVYIIMILAAIIVAWIFYDFFSKIGRKDRTREKIKKMFNASERDEDLYFKFRGYDVIMTFKPDIKVSIVHNKNVENVSSPKGAKLTPLYLSFKVRNIREIGEKLDEYVDFIDSIPTQ